MLTDVDGVKDKKGKLIERLSKAQAARLIKNGTAQGGMIPEIANRH